MRALSLFDGMACGMVAFLRAGMPVSEYHAYEIDKYATKTSIHNFPSIVHHGDVFGADFTQYEGFDFLIGGSPCTYWSIAQSPDKRETTASGIGWELFSQYVRALKEARPKFFIYENNKSMSRTIYESISATFGFEPIMINSALVSAQNRQRYYWVGKRNEDGSYSKVDVQQPEDRGILLRDVLDGYDLTNCDKSYCLTSSYDGACAWNTIERHQRTMVTEPVRCFILPRKDGVQTESKQYRVYETEGKSTTLCAEGGGIGAKTGLYAVPVEVDENGKPTKAVSCTDGKTYTVYNVEQGLIAIKERTYPIKLLDGYYIIRKLTVSECKRLQTVPEWYEFPVSDTRAYKMLGNGWTVEVIAHILREIMKEEELCKKIV